MSDVQPTSNLKTALVLPGGGARGAFQVGVLKADRRAACRARTANPFPDHQRHVGRCAINSVVLASRARSLTFQGRGRGARTCLGPLSLPPCLSNRQTTGPCCKSSLRWIGSALVTWRTRRWSRCRGSLLDNCSATFELLSRNVRIFRVSSDAHRRREWLDAISSDRCRLCSSARSTILLRGCGESDGEGSGKNAAA